MAIHRLAAQPGPGAGGTAMQIGETEQKGGEVEPVLELTKKNRRVVAAARI